MWNLLPAGGCLFTERVVEQLLDISLILGDSFATCKFASKFKVTNSQPDAHLFGRWFEDVRSFQFPTIILTFVQELRTNLLQYAIRAEPFLLVIAIHFAATFPTLL